MLTHTHAHVPDETDDADTGSELEDLLGDELEDDEDPDYDLYDDVDEL